MKRILLVFVLLLPAVAFSQSAQQRKPQPPAATKAATAQKAEPVWLSPQQAAQRYQEAVKAESEGYERRAFVAYLEAAENGHGLSQKKMGDLFSRNGPVVKRDYETSLRWYEKARAQGVRIPKPAAFTKGY